MKTQLRATPSILNQLFILSGGPSSRLILVLLIWIISAKFWPTIFCCCFSLKVKFWLPKPSFGHAASGPRKLVWGLYLATATWCHVCLALALTQFHVMHVFNAAGANQVAKNAAFVWARNQKYNSTWMPARKGSLSHPCFAGNSLQAHLFQTPGAFKFVNPVQCLPVDVALQPQH